MYKKIISILILSCILLSLCACTNNNNINEEDGKIKTFKSKNEYSQGEYYTFSMKYDNSGKAPYMKINIKNNIITAIHFNYIYKNGKQYIDKNDNNSELTFYINSLNTKVLQNQDLIKNTQSQYEDTYNVYKILLKECLNMAKTGQNKISYINLNEEYTVSDYKYDKNGYNSTLKVSYKNGVISDISFTKNNKDDISITSNKNYLKQFNDINKISYQKYIQNIIDLSIGENIVVYSLNKKDIDKEYNTLAKKINQKAKNFNYKEFKIFKNIDGDN